MTPLHKAARDWATAGYPVFPCHAGDKRPACEHGHKEATTDLAQIDRWWTENGEFNIGCAPDACDPPCFVLDVDPPLGRDTLTALEATCGSLPATYTVVTPRGGFHYWFEGRCPSSVSKLGPKLDTRGIGGYVLLPPSVVKGNPYVPLQSNAESEIAGGPSWIAEKLRAAEERHEASTEELDLPHNTERAKRLLADYVREGDVATEGQGGDDRTYRLAAEVLNLGLSEGNALDLIRDIWNPHCNPPWEEEDLETKVRNAAEYAQNEAGAWAVQSPQDAFAQYASIQSGDTRNLRLVKPSRFRPLTIGEAKSRPPPTWLLPDFVPDEGFVIVYGKPKSFKSFLVLDAALGLSAGVETFGFKPAPRTVIYVVGEGQNNLVHKHVPAWLLARNVEGEIPFYIVPHMPRAAIAEEVADIIAQIKARDLHPAMVVLDTKARAMRGLDENGVKDVGYFTTFVDALRETFNCAVVVISHEGKTAKGSRGTNADIADADTVIRVAREKKTLAVAAYVEDQRNAAEREEPWRFHGRVIGPSLVFSPMSAADYAALVATAHTTSKAKVFAALKELGAVGKEKGVTRAVLAAHLAAHSDEDASLIERVLGKEGAAEKPLEAYHDGPLWFVPD